MKNNQYCAIPECLYKIADRRKKYCKQLHTPKGTPAEKQKEYRRMRLDAIYRHYGNKCSCCGETTREFLSLDHMNNDGVLYRKDSNGKFQTESELLRIGRELPEDIQIMCFNCNMGRQRNEGICPHLTANINRQIFYKVEKTHLN